jgi:hypothetical protein
MADRAADHGLANHTDWRPAVAGCRLFGSSVVNIEITGVFSHVFDWHLACDGVKVVPSLNRLFGEQFDKNSLGSAC